MVNGSEPEPWHCLPLVEASTYGLELVYPYQTEAHIINDNGEVRLEWDWAREPGGVVSPREISLFATKPVRFYSFVTSVDLQTPPGYVLQTQPHPRYYLEDSETVPLPLSAHVQSEWWPASLFVVFKIPPRGHRHIFRKDEPFVKVLAVPQRLTFDAVEMSYEEQFARNELDKAIVAAKPYVAKNIWHNPRGTDFDDHYKMLSHAFARDGIAGVQQTLREANEEARRLIPPGLAVPQYLELAERYQREQKFELAKEVYFHIRDLEPRNSEAAMGLGIVAGALGLQELSLKMMVQAVELQPRSAAYRASLGEALRNAGRLADAESAFRSSLQLNPQNPTALNSLGQVVAAQGRAQEAATFFEAARNLAANSPSGGSAP